MKENKTKIMILFLVFNPLIKQKAIKRGKIIYVNFIDTHIDAKSENNKIKEIKFFLFKVEFSINRKHQPKVTKLIGKTQV